MVDSFVPKEGFVHPFTRRSLHIGINVYEKAKSDFKNLNQPENDAKALNDLFGTLGF